MKQAHLMPCLLYTSQVHGVVVVVVAHQTDAVRPFRVGDVFHCQVFVAAPFEGDEIHFTVDDVGEVADGLKAYDVTGLELSLIHISTSVPTPRAR